TAVVVGRSKEQGGKVGELGVHEPNFDQLLLTRKGRNVLERGVHDGDVGQMLPLESRQTRHLCSHEVEIVQLSERAKRQKIRNRHVVQIEHPQVGQRGQRFDVRHGKVEDVQAGQSQVLQRTQVGNPT